MENFKRSGTAASSYLIKTKPKQHKYDDLGGISWSNIMVLGKFVEYNREQLFFTQIHDLVLEGYSVILLCDTPLSISIWDSAIIQTSYDERPTVLCLIWEIRV